MWRLVFLILFNFFPINNGFSSSAICEKNALMSVLKDFKMKKIDMDGVFFEATLAAKNIPSYKFLTQSQQDNLLEIIERLKNNAILTNDQKVELIQNFINRIHQASKIPTGTIGGLCF